MATSFGMSKHRKMGIPKNHKIARQRARDENRKLNEEAELRKKRKPPMFKSVKEALFNNTK